MFCAVAVWSWLVLRGGGLEMPVGSSAVWKWLLEVQLVVLCCAVAVWKWLFEVLLICFVPIAI